MRSGPLLLSYLVLLRVGFSLPRTSPSGRCALTLSPVARGRTFSPLPRQAGAVYFLWHCPCRPDPSPHWLERPDRPWPLASTLPCGVRTFLSVLGKPEKRAIARPARRSTSSMRDSPMKFNRARSHRPAVQRLPVFVGGGARGKPPCRRAFPHDHFSAAPLSPEGPRVSPLAPVPSTP